MQALNLYILYKDYKPIMENYEIIKSYLETFPEDTEVKDVISNIKKAEKEKGESLIKLQTEMEENVGKCYYYNDIDDSLNSIQIYTKITGTKILEKRNVVLYTAITIEISDDTIYYIKDVTFDRDDLKENKLIYSGIFDEVERRYKELKNFKHGKK